MNNLKLSLGVPIIAGSLLVLAAFQSFHSTGDPKSGIILENMDKQVVPGNNFMEYVNGTWIKKTEIPADKPSARLAAYSF